ncbi:MAG: methyltransferase domain-containing protein [Anaerolineales bacterium]|nr:methyltransferase domain-containing protein [Anaerolineales bacterium]
MTTPKDLLGTISGGRVLDVATGGGTLIGFLLEGLRDFDEIIGIDTSTKGAAAFEKAFAGQNIRFLQMDAAAMEFPDQTFNLVCIANSLHHMPDLPAVLAEMLRVLKSGGRFVVLEMYRDNQAATQLTHVHLHHWWAAVDRRLGIPHQQTFTRQEIIELLGTLNMEAPSLTDLSDLSSDPRDPETVRYLDGIIDQYKQRAAGLPDQETLQARGEELRQQVHEIGFHSATSLFLVGRKP